MSYADQQITELRQRIALLERQVAFLMAQLGVEYYEEPNAGVSPEILDLVRQGRKIEAIKLYRLETGVGLREAKEFVDSLG
jgi:ribosomal protein L7/L12